MEHTLKALRKCCNTTKNRGLRSSPRGRTSVEPCAEWRIKLTKEKDTERYGNDKDTSNGVRVITKRKEGLLSVTMGVLVGTGAAFERDEEDGISHFIEHMQFKGTEKFTAFELSDAFDAIGAQVNAFTGKDLTCYYAKSTSDHAKEAFSLLSELFLRSTFPKTRWRARRVS